MAEAYVTSEGALLGYNPRVQFGETIASLAAAQFYTKTGLTCIPINHRRAYNVAKLGY